MNYYIIGPYYLCENKRNEGCNFVFRLSPHSSKADYHISPIMEESNWRPNEEITHVAEPIEINCN
jgi:hypothetical protein